MNRNVDSTRDPGLPEPDAKVGELVAAGDGMPAVLLGHATPEVAAKVEGFCRSVADMLEAWIQRSQNPNTQRTYRRAVFDFIEFLGIDWPESSHELLAATVPDVRAWRDGMAAAGKAPATLNARLSAVSGFYRFMREVSVTELKLPIQVPNPAHAQFIGRENTDPVSPTSALTLSKAKRLLAFPSRDHILKRDALLLKRFKADAAVIEDELDVLVSRDRAILATFLYTGARIGSVSALHVADFHDDEDDPTISFREKGRSRSKRRIGVNFICAEALRDYLERSGFSKGPLFRARSNPRSAKLGERTMSQAAMYRLLLSFLERVPGAMVEEELPDGTSKKRCRYSPHSLRATTATLLDEAGVPIKRIQELLGHKDIRVTQAYIKLLRDTRKSASHDMPL
jgi:integrase